MSFFLSVLNPSDDVPTFSPRNRESGISLTFTATSDNNDDSIAGKVTASDAGNGDDDNAADGADSSENNRTSAGNDERFGTSTEGLLGFETETENEKEVGVWDNLREEEMEMASPPMVVKEDSGSGKAVVPVVIRERARARIFPPLLSTLNRNGRPLFNMEMVREAGRLQIVLVPNYWPEVTRTPPGDDRVRINFISRGDKDGDVEKKKK